MRWRVQQGDILDIDADVLICSANVYLTLSGGVGGAFLLRYGLEMQAALERYLMDRNIRHVESGDVVEMPPCGSPYRAVLHAVAVDGFYASSGEVVGQVISASLQRAAALSVRTVALAGLAMGYGRLPVAEFAAGLGQVLKRCFPPVEEVVVCLRSAQDVEDLSALLPAVEVAVPGSTSRGVNC